MQTFMLDYNFARTAVQLDSKRLGKQRVEAYQILRVLSGQTKGWRNHPAVLMWHGHEGYFSIYGEQMSREWIRRGFRDTLMQRFHEFRAQCHAQCHASLMGPPEWMKSGALERVIESHKSNLVRKDPLYYRPRFPDVPPDLPYFWPVTKHDVELKRVLELCP